MQKKHLRIAILGYGTVGRATVDILQKRAQSIADKSGVYIEVVAVLLRTAKLDIAPSVQAIATCDRKAVLEDENIDCYVELIGGVDVAYSIVRELLSRGKFVVTANKAMLALHGEELWALARKNNTCIGVEASCCAGVPLIRAIADGLIANSIHAVYGIVNGTCNFILTKMEEKSISYKKALEISITQGIAEADPSLDVQGLDAAHKIAIMSSLAFSLKVSFSDIAVQGIDNIDQVDMRHAKELGYRFKLIAAAYKVKDGITIWVRPVLLIEDHPLAAVKDTFNAVSIFGDTNGHTLYYGRGAGGEPTASAVIGDIISIGIGNWQSLFEYSGQWQDLNTHRNQVPAGQTQHRYYLRMHVDDSHGVLAEIAAVFTNYSVSFATVLQKKVENQDTKQALLIIITHETLENNMKKVLSALENLSCVYDAKTMIPIFDLDEEKIASLK